MRVLLCDHQVVFAESLAHVLATRGTDVVSVTHDIDEALAALRREVVDVCVLDIVFGELTAVDRLDDLRAAAPEVRFVLLSGHLDRALLRAADDAGVAAVADKRQPVAEIIQILQQVFAGEPTGRHSRIATDGPQPSVPPANDAQRLAAYLTPREREVLSALVRGDDTGKLARTLGVTVATARCHIQNVLTKMGTHSRLEVATTAVRYGMVDPENGEWLTPDHPVSPGSWATPAVRVA
jgi:two-component system nitrate/nitrite response regulator NarL